MIGSLIDYVKLSASSVTMRLAGMVAIAVPFLIAASFGLAAIYIAIANAYNELTAAVSLAIAFAIIGLIMIGVMVAVRRRQEAARQEALTHARRSLAASAFLAANPAMLLGAGGTALRLVRRAPLLTILPLAAGFIFAITRSSSKERDEVER
jgi:hypothetical protein